MVLGGLAVGLLNFGDRVGKISAGMFTIVAMVSRFSHFCGGTPSAAQGRQPGATGTYFRLEPLQLRVAAGAEREHDEGVVIRSRRASSRSGRRCGVRRDIAWRSLEENGWLTRLFVQSIMIYALVTYHWRATAIRKRGSGPYDDRSVRFHPPERSRRIRLTLVLVTFAESVRFRLHVPPAPGF